jgi:hypothetical protein
VNLSDEMAKHGLSYIKVSYHSILQGANSFNISRSAAQHHFGIITHSKDLVVILAILAHCYHRGLVKNNTLSLKANQGICCAQVYSQIV